MYDIIIIGAGPAGLTAALYALRANKKILILEANQYGGQIVTAHKIENYPAIENISGIDFAKNLYNQVKKLGGEVVFETVLHISEDRVVTTNKNSYQGKTIIIATGAKNRKLGLVEETKFIGKGVSYCASCDGNLFRGKKVAVIGGGNAALEDALFLADLCSKVYLIHRRDTFRGEERSYNKLQKKDNVEFILNSTCVGMNGQDKLESIMIKNNNEEVSELKVDGLFIAVGQEPANEIFKNVIDIDEKGYIIAHDEVYTSREKIFVAGDARVKKLRQLTTAVSDGSLAAIVAMGEANN